MKKIIGGRLCWRKTMTDKKTEKDFISCLRERRIENDCAVFIGYGNRFIGQDILPQEHKLKYLCGFTGSDGAVVITQNEVFLFVDGRYELQARQEVDLEKTEVVNLVPGLNGICDFLQKKKIKKLIYDGWCVSDCEIRKCKTDYPQIEFVEECRLLNLDKQDKIEVKERSEVYAGKTRDEKLSEQIRQLQLKQADFCLITAADSVSWLLNIYARDLPYSPVVRAYALVGADGSYNLIGDNLETVLPVMSFAEFERWLSGQNGKILYDAESIPAHLKALIKKGEPCADYCFYAKARKNKTELDGMINCHKRDGAALVKLLCWLQKNSQGKTETDIVSKLHEFRQEQSLFFSESFATISGAAENAAVVHYQPTLKTNRRLEQNNLLLLDSGGQYLDGTTDVTRTVALGKPTAAMVHDFTLVLKGHIGLASAKFPKKTSGSQLDALARAPLWQEGKDFKHGTGHGAACFGNVHEGPYRISPNAPSRLPLQFSNIVTSIEPGYYKENAYGIRIENLYYTRETPDDENFLEFVPLTLVPIDKSLIDVYLLNREERAWLNNYHQKVYGCLAACVNDEEKKWLAEACSSF